MIFNAWFFKTIPGSGVIGSTTLGRRPRSIPEGYPFSGLKETPHEGDWGVIPGLVEAEYDDSKSVDYAVRALVKKRDKPFFLACGIFRPHLPWYAPKKYFDLYPLEKIKLPERVEDDLQGAPPQGVKLSAARRNEFLNIKKQGKWKEGVRAYLASISFADAQLGRLLDALGKSSHAENTIIVFWSDHGWHLGEKNHWHKSTLWEEATRIPFMISVPGLTKGGARCGRPVDTLCVFPTLIELCGLKPRKDLDGVSIVPLLKKPEVKWDLPAVTEYKRGQCAVRSERFRYIRYSDGTEELYDHSEDPNEWNNLAEKKPYRKIMDELGRSIPKKFAPDAPSKGAYQFDHKTYAWTHKKTGKITQGAKK